ncbi:MAG: hypothetical protein SF002_04600 [Alphaproteobacteria bacterium]|nr:hypothetical protein [Alphaproteobacteria bacterium]
MAKSVPEPAPTPKPRSRLPLYFAWAIAPLVAIFFWHILAFLFLAMLPTIVAGFLDRREGKYAAYAVGGFNLSGAIPFLFQMLDGTRPGMVGLVEVISSPFPWLVILGAAAIGWVIYYTIPTLVLRYQGIRDRQRIKYLRQRQVELVDEWGPEVAPDETTYA